MNFDAVMIGNEPPLFLRIFNEVSDRAGNVFTRVRCFAVTRCLSCLKTKSQDENPVDLAFLRQSTVAPFPVRFALEAAEAARAFVFDPVAFIKTLAEERTVSKERQTRRRTGLVAAATVYAATLSLIYGSYAVGRRHQSTVPKKHIEVTLLAPAPAIAMKSAPVKQAGGSNNQLSLPKQSIEQPKPKVIRATPEARPLDQLRSKPEPVQIARSAAANEPSASSSSTGGGMGTGNGTGSGSGGGPGFGSGESVDYNAVFSVGSVTVKPQILGRPIPTYPDEARRNQIEGSVKISVVLKADGTVSDIKITRGLGYGLDEKAVEAARQLRFVPAQKDSRVVSVRVFLEFKFSLL